MNLRHCIYPSPTSDDDPSSPDTPTTLQTNPSLRTLPSVPSLQLPSLSPSPTPSSPLPPPPPTTLPVPTSSISALALSGALLYAASGHRVHVYDSLTLSHLHSFNSDNPSSGAVKSIAFSSSLSRVLTSHLDGNIRVWRPSKPHHRLIATLPTVADRLRYLALPANYVQVRRHKTKLWLQHNDAVSSLHFNNNLIYSVSWDKTLKIWRSSDLRCLESLTAHDDAVNAVSVSPNGVIYTGSADSRIRVWSKLPGSKKHELLTTLSRHKSGVNALALSSNGAVLFSGAGDRSILVWEKVEGPDHMRVAGALRGHTKAILCVVNVSDFLLSGSADRTVRMWRRGMDGQYCCLSVLEGHLKPVKCLAATCESQRSDEEGLMSLTVFSGSLDGEIRVSKLNVSLNN